MFSRSSHERMVSARGSVQVDDLARFGQTPVGVDHQCGSCGVDVSSNAFEFLMACGSSFGNTKGPKNLEAEYIRSARFIREVATPGQECRPRRRARSEASE
jgi:hypothetical protein